MVFTSRPVRAQLVEAPEQEGTGVVIASEAVPMEKEYVFARDEAPQLMLTSPLCARICLGLIKMSEILRVLVPDFILPIGRNAPKQPFEHQHSPHILSA